MFSELRLRMIDWDLGRQSLRNAFRGTLTIVISFMALGAMARHWGQAPTLAFVGVMIAMMSSMVISDATVRQQKRTMLWMFLPASVSMSLSIALAPHRWVQMGAFLVVTFFAVSARRFGLRFVALGVIAFMAYIAPMFFPIGIESLPWVLGAVFFAIFIAFLMRFVFLRDRPAVVLSLYLEAFDFRLQELLREIRDILANPEDDVLIRKTLRRRLSRINELNVTIEQFLNTGTSRALKSESEALQLSLFEREMNVRKLLESLREFRTRNELTEENREKILAAMDALLERKALGTELEEIGAKWPTLRTAFLNLASDQRKALLSSEALPEVLQELREEKKAGVVSKVSFQGLHATTKQAIQATLATGVASALGMSLSPQRWYWASITAFVVFAGTSRGDTITRALFRILGTFLGLIVGFVLAEGLDGHPRLEWSAIILFIFFGILFARAAYGFFSAFVFTLMLAVLFDIMNLLNIEILMLRLEETVVGALVGALISVLVLPTSTRTAAREAVAKLLRTMGDIAELLPLENQDPNAAKDLVRRLRLMDKDILAMRTTAAPMLRKWSVLRKGQIPQALHDISAIAYYLRHLATAPAPSEGSPRIRRVCTELAKDLRFLAGQLELHQNVALRKKLPEEALGNHFLERIFQLLNELSERKL